MESKKKTIQIQKNRLEVLDAKEKKNKIQLVM